MGFTCRVIPFYYFLWLFCLPTYSQNDEVGIAQTAQILSCTKDVARVSVTIYLRSARDGRRWLLSFSLPYDMYILKLNVQLCTVLSYNFCAMCTICHVCHVNNSFCQPHDFYDPHFHAHELLLSDNVIKFFVSFQKTILEFSLELEEKYASGEWCTYMRHFYELKPHFCKNYTIFRALPTLTGWGGERL